MKIQERFNSGIARFFNVGGIVFYPFIFYSFRKQALEVSPEAPENWVRRHEWIHIDQIRKHGYFTFHFKYFLHYLINRFKGMNHFESYWNIPYEIEARERAELPRTEFK